MHLFITRNLSVESVYLQSSVQPGASLLMQHAVSATQHDGELIDNPPNQNSMFQPTF